MTIRTLLLRYVSFCYTILLLVAVNFSANLFALEEVTEETIDYSLFFSPEKNNVEVVRPLYVYDFTDFQRMKLGNVEFSLRDFGMTNANFGYKYLNHYNVMNALGFKWPLNIMKTGRLTVEDPKGNIIFSHQITPQDYEKWSKDLQSVQNKEKIDKYSYGTSTYQKNIILDEYKLGFVESKEEKLNIFKSYIFRFCIEAEEKQNSARICSPFLQRLRSGKITFYRRVVPGFKTFSRINDREIPVAKGEIPILSDMDIHIQLANGFEVKSFLKNPNISIAEVLKFKDGSVLFVGQGELCKECTLISREHIVEFNNLFSYMDLFNQGRTYNEPKVYWYKKVSSEDTSLSYSVIGAPDAAIFDYDFLTIPQATDKPKIIEPSIEVTYSSDIDVYLEKPGDNYFLETDDGEVQFDPITKVATWNIPKLKKGVNNTNYLKIYKDDKPFVLKHTIYRGYPVEASGRMTLVSSETANTALLSEVNFSYWAESLFGWKDELFSHHRWGANLKYFQSLVKFKDPNFGTINMTSFTADLKYRLTPGLWNWDESYGLTISYQHFTFIDTVIPMFGPGFVWVRSMPKFFDRIMNVVPFFRYPKWVEAEFIYYPLSLDANITLPGPNYALNYRGKILWTNDFYGEAGFGVKAYSFLEPGVRSANPFFFYVTGGFGFQF